MSSLRKQGSFSRCALVDYQLNQDPGTNQIHDQSGLQEIPACQE
jgi:hypothetical protein